MVDQEIDFTLSPEIIKNNILTMPPEKQDLAIAAWFMRPDCQNDMRERPFPSWPDKVKTYYCYSKDIRREMNKFPENYKSFWHDPIVKDYFDTVGKITEINQRNKDWNVWARKILSVKEEDIEWSE